MNEAIREGPKRPQPATKHGDPPKTSPHHFGFRLGIDLDKLSRLVDELETEAVAARYRLQARYLASYSRTERSVSAT